MGKKRKRAQMLPDPGIPDTSARQRYAQQLGDQLRDGQPDELVVRAADGTELRQYVPRPRLWQEEVCRRIEPAEEVQLMQQRIEANARRMQTALDALREAMLSVHPPGNVLMASGGWATPSRQVYELDGWDTSPYRKQDPRQGQEVYVYDLLPGARVYVLEDVFTVDHVDMDAPLPTVWLKELPTSPLYFSEDEYIYLANETED